jgi:hypothetical protein
MIRIPPYNRQGQLVVYQDLISDAFRYFPHLQSLLTTQYGQPIVDDGVVPFGTLYCSDTVVDSVAHGILNIANAIVVPLDIIPVNASEVAHLRILVAVARQGGSIVAYAGYGYDVGHLQHILAHYGIQVTELKGSVSHVQKRQKTFHIQPRQTIVLLHPLYIDRVNISEASHIVIMGDVIPPTDLKQIIGRATRFGRTKPLYIIRIRVRGRTKPLYIKTSGRTMIA